MIIMVINIIFTAIAIIVTITIIVLQAVIRLKSDGEYCVINEGRRSLLIDGKPICMGVKARLHHNSTFEVRLSQIWFIAHYEKFFL